jgi:hypothetical protein
MVIYLYGPDSYRRIKNKEAYLAATRNKYPYANLNYFDFSQNAESDFLNFAQATPLFSPVRVAVLSKTSELSKEGRDVIKAACDSPLINLIIDEDKVLPVEYAFLKKKASVVEDFPLLTGPAWREFATAEGVRLGMEVKDTRLIQLVTTYEGDSWSFATEAARGALHSGAVCNLIIPPSDIPGFAFGRREERLLNLARMSALGEAPARLFYASAAMTAKNHTPLWAGYDAAVKTGKLDYEEALLDFALS